MKHAFILRETLIGCRQLLFPPICLHCRRPVEDSHSLRTLCERCARGIHYVREPCCDTCGHPFFGDMVEDRCCPHCASLRSVFGKGRTAVLYRGVVRSLVIELKYHGGRHVARDLVVIFRRAAELLDFARGATLVPVPMHPRKMRERGFNQTWLIAEALAEALQGEVDVQHLLIRQSEATTQTAFGRQDRANNLKNAFALAPGVSIKPGHRYILLDDIFTTGSTLNACAQVLRSSGCLDLDVITFAHG